MLRGTGHGRVVAWSGSGERRWRRDLNAVLGQYVDLSFRDGRVRDWECIGLAAAYAPGRVVAAHIYGPTGSCSAGGWATQLVP